MHYLSNYKLGEGKICQGKERKRDPEWDTDEVKEEEVRVKRDEEKRFENKGKKSQKGKIFFPLTLKLKAIPISI